MSWLELTLNFKHGDPHKMQQTIDSFEGFNSLKENDGRKAERESIYQQYGIDASAIFSQAVAIEYQSTYFSGDYVQLLFDASIKNTSLEYMEALVSLVEAIGATCVFLDDYNNQVGQYMRIYHRDGKTHFDYPDEVLFEGKKVFFYGFSDPENQESLEEIVDEAGAKIVATLDDEVDIVVYDCNINKKQLDTITTGCMLVVSEDEVCDGILVNPFE